MQKSELLVLLKVLRGASSIPNLTFVCAFSPEHIKAELFDDAASSHEYLEKFFPISVNLTPPDPDMLGRLFQAQLKTGLAKLRWFKTEERAKKFDQLLEQAWSDTLSKLCTNLRKLSLLLNDVLTAAQPIVGEVDPFDLIMIETTRRFYPRVYAVIKTNPLHLTYQSGSWSKGEYFTEDEKKKRRADFLKTLEAKIENSDLPRVARTVLSSIFPEYEPAIGERTFRYSYMRQTNREVADEERRICSADYFPIYFRSAVPDDMFSNAELNQVVSDLNASRTDDYARIVFSRILDSIPTKNPKREDFLLKINLALDSLSSESAERLAYAVSQRASDYTYDMFHIGEAARGVNLVFGVAQKLSGTDAVQRVLEGAIACASDDTFAERIVKFTENRDRNKILLDFSHVEVEGVKRAFIDRMRKRYGATDLAMIDIKYADWDAFRRWVDNSQEDRAIEQDFWKRFIGRSRKRLAQAINVLYRADVVWAGDPQPVINSLFPLDEFRRLLTELDESEELNDAEQRAFVRLQELFEGKYPKAPL